MSIETGAITAVIGSNGAGKTTLLRSLSGLLKPRQGSIRIGDAELAGAKPLDFVNAGIAHVPEGRRLFAGMTVEDNLLMGAFARAAARTDLQRDLDRVYAAFPKLAERRRQDAVSMSGGEQQMCAIGRGLMSRPRVMMIDELSLGLAPVAVDFLVEALKTISADGVGIAVVEQDVAVALDLAKHVVVMDRGRVSKAGSSQEISQDHAIRAAYLGAD
ncbi:ABC transporter ATP-binding protein [Bradyrhizobium elkanii]|uniref:ABC transporter ATP-binding protein n=2 Tax=Bradyrhizobium TaxID=374 RepID=A0A4U6RI89_BRAEL|nr:ABC transporter ATP-binding protein [Bradyrhizobium sp. BR2003]TKV73653.1 ABC transporter ATP-binding protein [Bradyrhizobium elkanii]